MGKLISRIINKDQDKKIINKDKDQKLFYK